jgi:hypothetical protein
MTVSPDALKAGREALGKIDAIIAARPKKDDEVLSDTTQALCTYRDGLIAEGPIGPGPADAPRRERLETLNAVLTVVLGTHFPTADTPWDELVKARTWLADLLPAT